ncbi:MAG: extracellular solute-binding protein [Chloroflexi bacterium]|nr:extracellular solute-binding protein [Chloroflexota bacterium]
MKDLRTLKLVTYLAGALIIALLIARLPLRSVLPGADSLPGLGGSSAKNGIGTPGAKAAGKAAPTADPKAGAAIKEGKVVWWFTFNEAAGQQVLAAFHSRYPQVSVSEHLGLPPSQLYPRLVADLRAGTADVDVVTLTDVDLAYDLQQRNAWASYLSPQAQSIAEGFKSQPAGYWTVTDYDPIGVVWNSRAITATASITSYWDLVQPDWKGRLGIAESQGESQLAPWQGLSATLGPGYWDQIGKNRPRVFSSPDALLAQVSAGALPVAVNAPWSTTRHYLHSGGDLRLLLPAEGVPARFSASGLLATAPRPNAGKLFLDFLLSPEGQRLLGPGLRGTYPMRPDAPSPAGLPPSSSFTLMRPQSWEEYAKSSLSFPGQWERDIGKWR